MGLDSVQKHAELKRTRPWHAVRAGRPIRRIVSKRTLFESARLTGGWIEWAIIMVLTVQVCFDVVGGVRRVPAFEGLPDPQTRL